MPDLVSRVQEIRAMVEAEPGLTGKEIADRLGLTPGRVCQILSQMRKTGDLTERRNERGIGMHISDQALRRKYIRERWR
jgi:DNA-binding MarR family transcriptional regulator